MRSSQYFSRSSKESLSTLLPTTFARWILSHRRPRSPRGRPSANCREGQPKSIRKRSFSAYHSTADS